MILQLIKVNLYWIYVHSIYLFWLIQINARNGN